MEISFGSTIKLVSFDESQVVTFNGEFVYGFRNGDCGTESQSDNTVGSPRGFIINWIVISKNIKEVTEVIDVENWQIDNSRVLRWIVSLFEWNSSVSLTKSSIQIFMEYLVNISKRRAFWSLNEDILKITILKTNTPYPSRKIRHICACTQQRPQRNKAQYAVSRETQYAVFKK
ncbi:hypothetical protein Tco_0666526 [Tanacetum coccineum]